MTACAQDYPSRPVNIVIGYAPGGYTLLLDKWGRLLKLAKIEPE